MGMPGSDARNALLASPPPPQKKASPKKGFLKRFSDDFEQKKFFWYNFFFGLVKFFEKNDFPLFFIIGVRALIFSPSE